MKTIEKVSKEDLYNVILPSKTNYYTPVSHREIIEGIFEQLYKNNLRVSNSEYRQGREGRQMVGNLNIACEDSEFNMRIAFKNSYDKTMSFGISLGASVMCCENGILSGEFTLKRKHNGVADECVNEYIIEAIKSIGDMFQKVTKEANALKSILIEETPSYELVGRLLLEKRIVNTMQVNIIDKELHDSDNFKHIEMQDFTVWDFYNAITESLKKSHPMSFISDHSNFHEFMLNQFKHD